MFYKSAGLSKLCDPVLESGVAKEEEVEAVDGVEGPHQLRAHPGEGRHAPPWLARISSCGPVT